MRMAPETSSTTSAGIQGALGRFHRGAATVALTPIVVGLAAIAAASLSTAALLSASRCVRARARLSVAERGVAVQPSRRDGEPVLAHAARRFDTSGRAGYNANDRGGTAPV